MNRFNVTRKKAIAAFLFSLLACLFCVHIFLPPTLNTLSPGAIKAEYRYENSFCSAKAKAAYSTSAKDTFSVKTYCGVLGTWRGLSAKLIPARYLETEFSSLKLSDYITQAENSINLQNYTAALDALEKAVYLDPKADLAYTLTGLCYYRIGNNAQAALLNIQTALHLNPDSFQAHNTMALLLKDEQHYEGAYSHFNRVAELNPDAAAYANLAEVETKLGKIDEAIVHLERSLHEDTNNTALLSQLGLLYWNTKEYPKAALALERAYRIQPQNPRYFLNYFEISLITPTSLSAQEKESFREEIKENKNALIVYDMLHALDLAIHQKEVLPALHKWKETYSGIKLNWSFSQIFAWLDNAALSDEEKFSIKNSIGFFIAQQQIYNLEHSKGL